MRFKTKTVENTPRSFFKTKYSEVLVFRERMLTRFALVLVPQLTFYSKHFNQICNY